MIDAFGHEINDRGHLVVGGCDAVDLVREFGTPLYVMDEGRIRKNCRAYREAFVAHYPRGQALYAAKTFLVQAMCRVIDEEGLGMDVVSGGELYTALRAGFPAGRLYMNGNNKSADELQMALDAGVGALIVDNFAELETLERLARRLRTRARILLRVTPGIEAHTHQYIETGIEDSKFGFDLSSGQAEAAVCQALGARWLDLVGLQCHIGSQVMSLKPFQRAVDVMFEFAAGLRRRTGWIMEELDLGGGLGIRYLPSDEPPAITDLVATAAAAVRAAAARHTHALPRLVMEPGRSIAGDAGLTLYAVGARKEIPGVRTYVAVDGGMTDNPRPALYGAQYAAVIANRAAESPAETVTVAGKCCESGDILVRDIALPRAGDGDILAVFATGAYNFSMSSNYNRLTRPAVVFVRDGTADLVVRRQSYEDVLAGEIIPARLAAPGDLGRVVGMP